MLSNDKMKQLSMNFKNAKLSAPADTGWIRAAGTKLAKLLSTPLGVRTERQALWKERRL